MKMLIVVAALAAAPVPTTKAPQAEAVTLSAEAIKFGPVPPSFPAGGQLAVLHGDPGKKAPFTLRLKMPDGYKIAPHWHTNDEELTVVSGTFVLSMGDKFDAATAHSLGAGSFHFLPEKMHHAAMAKGETVVEVHGMGPFDIHYLDPKDDPSKAATQR